MKYMTCFYSVTLVAIFTCICASTLDGLHTHPKSTIDNLPIIRRRECERNLLWQQSFNNVSSISQLVNLNISTLPSEGWQVIDECRKDLEDSGKIVCRKKENVAITDNQLELFLKSDTKNTLNGAGILLTKKVKSGLLFHRLHLILQFPIAALSPSQSASVQLTIQLLNITMTAAVLRNPELSLKKNELLLYSSQEITKNIIVQVPCLDQVWGHSLNIDFEWNSQWIRWYANGYLLYEESVGGIKTEEEKARVADGTISLQFSLDEIVSEKSGRRGENPLPSRTSPFRVVKIELLKSAVPETVCAPRHNVDINCRTKKEFLPRTGSNQGSLSLSEIYEFIQNTNKYYPHISRIEEIGRSVEDRPIYALCLGMCGHNDTGVPQSVFTGMHHSREPISMMNLVYTIDLLLLDLENGDLDIIHLLFSRQLWFILVVNPDGYYFNEKNKLYQTPNASGQRKNARHSSKCKNRLVDGVDLNRNYDVCFEMDGRGSSNEPCAEDYGGPSAFSEPETYAIKKFIEGTANQTSVALNYHSFGKYINIPYACEPKGLPNISAMHVFETLAKEMASYNGFSYGQPWKDSNLYSVNGETSDWMYSAHGIYAMSPEVGPEFTKNSHEGFWPPAVDVPSLSAELYYTNLVAAERSGPRYELNITKFIMIDEVFNMELKIKNIGLTTIDDSAKLEIITSIFVNGSNSSHPVMIPMESIGNLTSPTTEAITTLGIPRLYSDAIEVEFKKKYSTLVSTDVYIVLRDNMGCSVYRLSIALDINRVSPPIQLWEPTFFPPCGVCSTFGKSTSRLIHGNEDNRCSKFADVTTTLSLQPHFRYGDGKLRFWEKLAPHKDEIDPLMDEEENTLQGSKGSLDTSSELSDGAENIDTDKDGEETSSKPSSNSDASSNLLDGNLESDTSNNAYDDDYSSTDDISGDQEEFPAPVSDLVDQQTQTPESSNHSSAKAQEDASSSSSSSPSASAFLANQSESYLNSLWRNTPTLSNTVIVALSGVTITAVILLIIYYRCRKPLGMKQTNRKSSLKPSMKKKTRYERVVNEDGENDQHDDEDIDSDGSDNVDLEFGETDLTTDESNTKKRSPRPRNARRVNMGIIDDL